ncbi:MAG: xanthine phosphoribosyltransferase [Parasporobacterium sp.]|nr:xanthine phosphoribosyltransferase [Lachnospiraceae bacterium]MBR3644342.1 xanthine phosphoribosyltransferase [Parasporobacterium sp.]
MKALEEKICREGKVYPGNVLKVGSFLNHQIDVPFMQQIGEEFHRLFQDEKITKVLTIETSGIPIACMTAVCFNVPVLFAKKHQTKNLSDDCYCTEIMSYTHGNSYQARIEKQYLSKDDTVLIIDDFLANGCALVGLLDLIEQAGAKCVGCGIVIEKAFQDGGQKLREMGVRVESLARIIRMDPETGIEFID